MREWINRAADVLLAPCTLAGSLLLKKIRTIGVDHMPLSKKIFQRVGVFPIIDHYYEPLFQPHALHRPLHEKRALPGIDLNVPVQLDILKQFHFNAELEQLPVEKQQQRCFYYNNAFFSVGDAEYFYNLLRLYQPARLVEVGGGFSTLLAREALQKNAATTPGYHCTHLCIEPYEHAWLEESGAEIVRQPVQQVDRQVFAELGRGDILFIDSSHVIRPQGDVVYLYLEILPLLQPGVLVHLHDIFTPMEYPTEWVVGQVRLWNEQYLAEAFLSGNTTHFEVIGALHFLARYYTEHLAATCPIYKREHSTYNVGSFWLRRVAAPTSMPRA